METDPSNSEGFNSPFYSSTGSSCESSSTVQSPMKAKPFKPKHNCDKFGTMLFNRLSLEQSKAQDSEMTNRSMSIDETSGKSSPMKVDNAGSPNLDLNQMQAWQDKQGVETNDTINNIVNGTEKSSDNEQLGWLNHELTLLKLLLPSLGQQVCKIAGCFPFKTCLQVYTKLKEIEFIEETTEPIEASEDKVHLAEDEEVENENGEEILVEEADDMKDYDSDSLKFTDATNLKRKFGKQPRIDKIIVNFTLL